MQIVHDTRYVSIQAFDSGDIGADGESTILTYRIPGVTSVPIDPTLGGDATWTFPPGTEIVDEGPRKLRTYPVPEGYNMVITNIEITSIDVMWPGVNAWLEEEEATDGRYGHGSQWTARVSGSAVPPWEGLSYPLQGTQGLEAPYVGSTPAGGNRRHKMGIVGSSRCFIVVRAGEYFTISARRKTDARLITGYAGAGTPIWTFLGVATQIGVLEHHCRVRAVLSPVGETLDLRHFWTAPDHLPQNYYVPGMQHI